MKNCIKIAFGLFLLCTAHNIPAQGTWTAFTSTESVNDICMDENYIWCATTGGIVRWNKADTMYTTFTMLDGLKHNNVKSVAVSSTGILWAGYTVEGLSNFDGETWTSYPKFEEEYTLVNAITSGHGNVMWFGTNRGMSCFDTETWTSYDLDCGEVLSVTVAPDSIVWAGTTRGVYSFNGVEWQRFSIDDGLPGNAVFSVAVDYNNIVWAGTNEGLVSYDGEIWTNYPDVRYSINSITVAPDSTIWFGADGRLFHYDGETWETVYMDYELGYDDIDALYISSEGALWA